MSTILRLNPEYEGSLQNVRGLREGYTTAEMATRDLGHYKVLMWLITDKDGKTNRGKLERIIFNTVVPQTYVGKPGNNEIEMEFKIKTNPGERLFKEIYSIKKKMEDPDTKEGSCTYVDLGPNDELKRCRNNAKYFIIAVRYVIDEGKFVRPEGMGCEHHCGYCKDLPEEITVFPTGNDDFYKLPISTKSIIESRLPRRVKERLFRMLLYATGFEREWHENMRENREKIIEFMENLKSRQHVPYQPSLF